MTALAPTPDPAYAIKLPQTSKGVMKYVLSEPGWQINSVYLEMDTSGSSAARTVYWIAFGPSSAPIVGSYVAVSVPASSYAYFSLAPYMNPCDTFSETAATDVQDTIPPLILTTGCEFKVSAVDAVSGAGVNDTTLTNGLLWVSDLDTGSTASLQPLLVPAPLDLSGYGSGAGG